MAKRSTTIRIDPGDYEKIENLVEAGVAENPSEFVRDAIKEKLNPYRVTVELDPEDVNAIRHLVDIGSYDSGDTFLREAARRMLYIAKDREMVREALFDVLLDDPAFKTAMQKYIHEVFGEAFRPPPEQ